MYNKSTIEMCKNFITQSLKVLQTNPHLWIAFQSNVLNDRNYLTDDFKADFNKMVDLIDKTLDFCIPKLNLNMRNSREITEVAGTIKSEYANRKITNVIDSIKTLKSSITSYKPTLFPILKETLSKNYSKVIEHVTEKGKMRVILFSNETHFDLKQIKNALLNCGVEEEDIFVHTFESKHTKEDIKTFLRNQNGFLICQDELFTGMEAKSVVYCISDNDYEKNVRVNVMRACEKLNIVYCYKKNYRAYIDFRSAKMDPTFMKECDKVMEDVAWKCVECEKIAKHLRDDEKREEDFVVCRTCCLGCHIGHEIELKLVNNVTCPCPAKHGFCGFKNVQKRSNLVSKFQNIFKR